MGKFIISGFADEIAADLDTQIKTLQKLNIRYMEIRTVEGKSVIEHSTAEQMEMMKKLTAGGIHISAIGSPIGKIGITDDFDGHLEKFRYTLETAQRFQTRNIRMFSFFIPEGKSPDDYRGEVLDRWSRMAELAGERNMVLLHENEKHIYGDTAVRCKVLLDAMQDFAVKAIFDPANFIQCRQSTYPEAYELLKDYVAYLHIKDAIASTGKVVPSGEGDGHVADILRALMERGFEGFISLEPHLVSGDISVDGEEMFIKAHTALIKILRELGCEFE